MALKNIWLIGTGAMAAEYAKVLQEIPCTFTVIGRGEQSAVLFEEKTGIRAVRGGLAEHLKQAHKLPDMAIVSTGVLDLAENTARLTDAGVKRILLEKPGGMNFREIHILSQRACEAGCDIFIAYNRRFYSSVLEAQKIIMEDGGVESFQFDFTEWVTIIEKLNKPVIELNGWLLTNSSHVFDIAFYMGGEPEKLESFTAGNLVWHPSGSIFSGAGVTAKGALFSYHANWNSAGRWGVEINTPKRKLIFRPLEKLQIMVKDSIAVHYAELDYDLDTRYKPGVYLQTQAFIDEEDDRFLTIYEQTERIKWYDKIMKKREMKK